jgi:hypothetical protein
VSGFRLLSIFQVPSDFLQSFYSLAAFFKGESRSGLERFVSRFQKVDFD